MAELVARLLALLRRRPHEARIPVAVGPLHLDPLRHEVTVDGAPVELTAREFELLEVFVRQAGVVLTRSELLSQVWGYDFDVQSNVVDVFVGYVRRKLQDAGAPPLIHTVRGQGFVLRAAVARS